MSVRKRNSVPGVEGGSGTSYKTALKTDVTPSRGTSGGLSRSHSSPNIAKMIQDEEAAGASASAQLPRQPPPNRSTKPQMYVCSQLGFMIRSDKNLHLKTDRLAVFDLTRKLK